MRRLAAAVVVLLGVGSLVGGLLPASAAPTAEVTLRIAPPTVAIGEPSGLVVQVDPVRADRPLEFQQHVDGAWTPFATGTTDARGRAFLALSTDFAGSTPYRVVSGPGLASEVTSGAKTLAVTVDTTCSPETPLVDPDPTGELVCLAERIDRWQDAKLMGVGQQLNVSSSDYLEPLEQLSDPVRVVGFDLEELALAAGYEFPFDDQVIADLLHLADEGAVLTASWHADNPKTGRGSTDTSWRKLGVLLDDDSPIAQRFWADWEEKLALLARFQDGDGLGGHLRTAVVVRPFHEANGDFFWWGKPDPRVYRQVWRELQDRAWEAGVHNILWAYSFNLHTSGVRDPATLVPSRVDLAGLDSYNPEKGQKNAKDELDLDGYAKVAKLVPRMAMTEVGPHGSATGEWNPAVITKAVRRARINPAWAMLWFDDGSGRNGISGRKQIGSLRGGETWLRGCFNGFCAR